MTVWKVASPHHHHHHYRRIVVYSYYTNTQHEWTAQYFSGPRGARACPNDAFFVHDAAWRRKNFRMTLSPSLALIAPTNCIHTHAIPHIHLSGHMGRKFSILHITAVSRIIATGENLGSGRGEERFNGHNDTASASPTLLHSWPRDEPSSQSAHARGIGILQGSREAVYTHIYQIYKS